MADKRITDVDFINSLDSNESFFVNKNNAIKQINRNNIVFGISNGGTSATTAEEALENLGASSKTYVNEQIETAIKTAKDYAELVADEKVESVKIKSDTVSLELNKWVDNKQTVNSSIVTSNNVIFISPSTTSYTAYCDANIRCIEQVAGSLTFQYEYAPNANLVVNVAAI